MKKRLVLLSLSVLVSAMYLSTARAFAQTPPLNCDMPMMDMSQSASSCPPASPAPTIQQVPQTVNTVRRNIYSLSADERTRLLNAMNTVRADGSYNRLMDQHMQAMMTRTPADETGTMRNAAHRGPVFLPWHRAFVREFEQLLRSVDPSVTIPYWAFENETTGAIPLVFSTSYFGSDGNIAQDDRVTDGPFVSWGIVRRIGRDAQGQTSLPSASDITTALQLNEYETAPYNEGSQGFNNTMEGWTGPNAPWGIHNRVHAYIGGDMLPNGMSGNAVNDPVFWLVHSNVDRLWWQWQQTHGVTNYQPAVGGPTGHNLNDVMIALPNQQTPASVLDIRNLNYSYN